MTIVDAPQVRHGHGAPAKPPLTRDEVRRKLPATVECLAYQVVPGRYRAICVDFSLVAESELSILDAQERLVAQIFDYVREVIDEGLPPHLVNRRLARRDALAVRALIAWRGLLGFTRAMLARANGGADRAAWTQPLPA